MRTIKTGDGTEIYYKDWGKGRPVVFSHGWPLNADAWDAQMLYLGQNGYRVIAHDRRGHGRSSQTWDRNEMDTYSDDLAALFEALDLKNAIMVGHSTGGGEVTRYLARHGANRVEKAVLISSVPPLMLKTEKNPGGLPRSAFDEIRAGVAGDRAQFYRDITLPFYGYNRPGAKISEGVREHWWLQGMMGGVKAHYDCVKAFSETDFNEDLKKIDIPVLVMHGDDDQIVPIGAAGYMSAKILRNATLKVYPGFPHGMPTTNADQINADLLAFLSRNSDIKAEGTSIVILGMSIATFTLVHVLISLLGLASGFVVLLGLIFGKRLERWTQLFLASTVLTSVSGFGFPFDRLLPSHVLGLISLGVLAAAIVARYPRHLVGVRVRTYAICASVALYLNVFGAVVQAFEKVPALRAAVPTPSEASFVLAQLSVLAIFVILGILAARRSRELSALTA